MALEKEDRDFAASVSAFLSANRKAMLAVLGTAVTAVIAVIVFFAVSEKMNAEAVSSVEKVIYDFEQFKGKNKPAEENNELSEDTYGEEKIAGTSDAVTAEEDKTIEALKALLLKHSSSYAAFRANTAIAEIYFQRKNYTEALKFYETAAKSVKKGYPVGLAYFNAAACSDELGDNEKALSLYKKASEVKAFPQVPRALFNIGRMYEALQKTDEAVTAYNKLLSVYPQNEWALLAKSRVIVLSGAAPQP